MRVNQSEICIITLVTTARITIYRHWETVHSALSLDYVEETECAYDEIAAHNKKSSDQHIDVRHVSNNEVV